MLRKQKTKHPRGLCVKGGEGEAEKQDLCASKAVGIKEAVPACL